MEKIHKGIIVENGDFDGDYDFRVKFLGSPVLDMKLDDRGLKLFGDGDKLIEHLKDLAAETMGRNMHMIEVINQRFRKECPHPDPDDTPKKFFRRSIEVQFLM